MVESNKNHLEETKTFWEMLDVLQNLYVKTYISVGFKHPSQPKTKKLGLFQLPKFSTRKLLDFNGWEKKTTGFL